MGLLTKLFSTPLFSLFSSYVQSTAGHSKNIFSLVRQPVYTICQSTVYATPPVKEAYQRKFFTYSKCLISAVRDLKRGVFYETLYKAAGVSP